MMPPFTVEPFAFQVSFEDGDDLTGLPDVTGRRAISVGYLATIAEKSVPMYVGSKLPLIRAFLQAVDKTAAYGLDYNFANDDRFLIFQISKPSRAKPRLRELRDFLAKGRLAPLAVIVMCDSVTVDAVFDLLKPDMSILKDQLG